MEIFFQSSLPRAGSTLLQNIMGQNPNFYVTPTSGVLELLYGARANFSTSPEFKAQDSQLMKSAFLNFCHNGLLGYYHGITDKPYVIDKSRGWAIHYNFLNSFYPNPKIICMVRDLRDIFSSMEKKFRQNQHMDMGIVNHAQMTGTSTSKRVDQWATSQPIGLAIERLFQIINEGIDKKILFVKYEDITKNPEFEINRIYSFLDIEPYIHDFNNIPQITKEDDSVYGVFGDHNIQNSIKFKPSDAKTILGKTIYDNIKINFKWFYEYFNYK